MLDNKALKTQLQHILAHENLATSRALITTLLSELNTNSLDCAAALLTLLLPPAATPQTVKADVSAPNIKMVRYRFAIGSQQQVTPELLTQVLVEESGVDKNNINNINIRTDYTLCDLPDEMPLDIFLHLKQVEINQQKLDIRRVKNRHNKRRGNQRSRREWHAANNN